MVDIVRLVVDLGGSTARLVFDPTPFPTAAKQAVRQIFRQFSRGFTPNFTQILSIAPSFQDRIVSRPGPANDHPKVDHLAAMAATTAFMSSCAADQVRQGKPAELEPAFDELAAKLRKLTEGRKHTPAEDLMREGRQER